MANSPFRPRCALSRVSVFYPEFGPRVPEDHPPACPAFVAPSRCPRQPGPPSLSIVRSSTATLASCGKGCTPILPEIKRNRFVTLRDSIHPPFAFNRVTPSRWNPRNFIKKFSSCSIHRVIKIIRSSAKEKRDSSREKERARESEKGAERERVLIDPGHRL